MNFRKNALEILSNVSGINELSEDLEMDLFEAEIIDSLSIIEIILEIENKFSVKLAPTDFEKEDLQTVINFEKFLERKIK